MVQIQLKNKTMYEGVLNDVVCDKRLKVSLKAVRKLTSEPNEWSGGFIDEMILYFNVSSLNVYVLK